MIYWRWFYNKSSSAFSSSSSSFFYPPSFSSSPSSSASCIWFGLTFLRPCVPHWNMPGCCVVNLRPTKRLKIIQNSRAGLHIPRRERIFTGFQAYLCSLVVFIHSLFLFSVNFLERAEAQANDNITKIFYTTW